ncbi:Uncharacterised protein [Mycobacteroides abscessus subsp. abscessus]|nr:Uncharacterised protein [Mycobacteroides abscessus subsp. abscessus]
MSRGPIGPAWLTGNLIAECLAQMLDQHIEFGKNVQASCCGTWDTAVVAGLDAPSPTAWTPVGCSASRWAASPTPR